MPAQNDALAIVLAIVIALAATGFAALAALTGPAPAAPRAVPDQACAEWTDGCVVCARTAQGLACSTPGIACQRGPGRCLRR